VEESSQTGVNSTLDQRVTSVNNSGESRRNYMLNNTTTNNPVYNFREPSQIPAEYKKTIAEIHEIFGQSVSSNLSSFLRKDIDITFDHIEQHSFSEYLKALSNPTCLTTFDMAPLTGYGILEINSSIIYSIINRMTGGEGVLPTIARAFTELEITIIGQLTRLIFKDLSDAWENLANIQFNRQEIHTNPTFIRTIPPRESCLIVTLKSKIADNIGLVTICYPYTNLEPLSSKISNTVTDQIAPDNVLEDIQKAHSHNLRGINLELSAVLGSISLTMKELLSLQSGDVLDLAHKTQTPIPIHVNGIEKFKATPGLIGKHRGIIISEELSKE